MCAAHRRTRIGLTEDAIMMIKPNWFPLPGRDVEDILLSGPASQYYFTRLIALK